MLNNQRIPMPLSDTANAIFSPSKPRKLRVRMFGLVKKKILHI